jgi:ADP-dependent NAD(P)H-hydrate dehydratase / NAD(P)H-hydrate epimerase
MPGSRSTSTVCLDVGSVWTKAVLVAPDGALVGFAEHPTTAVDVLTGVDAAVRAVSAAGSPGAGGEPDLLACSSAGGGLRLAVVGSEVLAATEAGHRVACSAGARVVHVHAGPLAAARVRYPIVLAANRAARDDALALLRATGRTVVTCDNVLPRRGEIRPEPARAAIAGLYRRHALGGRSPAVAPRFRRLVRVATPDAVARAAAELSRIAGGRVLVVDVGCATTDVHSAAAGADEGVRTVEGDLGVRATAEGVLVGAQTEGIVDPVEADLLGPTVARMAGEIGYLPADPGSAAEDRRIAALAAVVAVRRHLRVHTGPVDLVVLSGGVFRRPDPWGGLAAVASTLRSDPELADALEDVRMVIDADFAVAPAGLLAADGRAGVAEALLHDHLLS